MPGTAEQPTPGGKPSPSHLVVQFKEYTIGSAVGILPGVCLYVAIGRLASSIAEVVNGDVDTEPWVLILSVCISIVFLVIVVAILTRYAKKALAAKIDVAVADPQAGATQASEAQLSEAQPAQTEVRIDTSEGISAVEIEDEAAPAPGVASV